MLRKENSLKLKRKSLRGKTAPVRDQIVVIQIVDSSWGKASRGGQGAVLRNNTPEELPLPELTKDIIEPSFAVHTSEYRFTGLAGECVQNETKFQVFTAKSVFTCGSIAVQLIDERVHVDYYWKDSAGMPERYFHKDALLLEIGNWGRMLYNARLIPSSWHWGDWRYEKREFYIGYFSCMVSRVFRDTEPIKIHSQMQLMR